MKLPLLVTLFVLQVNLLFSQSTANYSFSSATNASLTSMSTGSTDLLVPTSVAGDFASGVVPIGFDFWLMGTRYADFSVNSNGLMRLGKTAVTTSFSNTAANSATNTASLYAFWDDLNSYTTSSTSRVRYKLTGSAPNRVLTVEWKDFVISYNSVSTTQLSTWQIRIYETTGVFEYVYGSMQIATGATTVTASIGMTYANSNNNLIFLTSISTPAVSRTAGSFVTNLVNSNVAGNITNLHSAANGSRVMYTFTPQLPSGPPTGLTFTVVGTSAMTLNWTNATTNEVGYVVYRSDDGGVTYYFVSQTAANAVSSVQSALSPATTYFWKVYAVTEGALSSSLNGSQATTSCGAGPYPVNTLTYTGSGAAVNWSTAAWSLGHSPTACENAVINFNRATNGTATYIVTLNVPATVNSLTINGAYGGNGKKLLQLNTGSNSLTVLGDLNISSTGGSSATSEVDLLASTGSVITLLGNSTIGQPADTKISAIGGVSGQLPVFNIKGNLTFNANALCSDPGSYYFNGGASQTLTNNSLNYYIVFDEVEIGKYATTTLTVAGTFGYDTYANTGNLVVHSGSTLSLPLDQAFNQFTSGTGNFILKANATLKLGDFNGGQAGSNFPIDYNDISIDPASTVEYNYAGASSPVIYGNVVYGNLILTNTSRKYNTTDLFIDGNFTINTGSTLGSDYPTYMFGTAVVNNGAIDGTTANSEFGFYGSTAQSYSGSGTFGSAGTPFGGWGVDIFNSANVTLSAPIYSNRWNLFNGGFINSNQVKIGTASFGLVQRGGATGYAAGSFDTYPVINCPNNYYIRYDNANAVTTGPEIPATGNAYNVYSDNLNGVTLASNLNVSNDLQLVQNTLNIASNTVKISNTITRTSGNINGSAGTVEMNGTVAQTIPASTFQSNNLSNLIISNTNNVTGVTLAGTLDIYRSLTFGTGGRKLTTGGYLTLKSTATETAWLGQMVATNTIVGDAGIERYIPLHSKAWQFLSTPITAASTQTVTQAWQEGSVAANDNLVSGYGTQLTSNRAGATTRPSPGFDAYTASGPSIKVFNHSTGGYIGLNRTDTAISNPKGYMVFVRGNRSVITSGGSPTATVMRTKGTLHTPANPPVTINVTTPGFESVGNPYASAINFRLLGFTGGVQTDFFYLWDPKLTTIGVNSSSGLGGFQNFAWNISTSSFDITPGGGSFSGLNQYIESGQAFFINAPLSAGTLSFSEACKVANSNDVNRVVSVTASPVKQIRTNLYAVTANGKILLDGNMAQFSRSWSNEVDIKDGIKLNNTGENIGLARNGKTLVVERRALIQNTDTLFYKIGQVKVQRYELQFIPANLQEPGLVAYLEDSYLNTKKLVSLHDTTRIEFDIINVPGSYSSDRFRLVFGPGKIREQQPVATTDAGRGTEKNDLSRNLAVIESPSINAYPNPVTNRLVNLQFIGQPAGKYKISLLSSNGIQKQLQSVYVNDAQTDRSVKLPQHLPAGVYRLKCVGPDNSITIISVTVL